MGKESRKKKPKQQIASEETSVAVEKQAAPPIKGILLNRWFHVALIIAIGLVSYANSFDVPFHFDDYVNILDNPSVKNWDNRNDAEYLKTHKSYKLLPTRIVGFFTFALNYSISGNNVKGYHAVNLAIHIINALLIYLLVVLTFKTPELIDNPIGKHRRYISLFSALVFVSHPVQTQAVTYIVQRFASLATMFYLISMVSYIKWRLSATTEPGVRSRLGWAFYAVALVSAALAMKTKEIAFTLPFVISVYEYIFFFHPNRAMLVRLSPLFLTILIIPLSIVFQADATNGIMGRLDDSSRLLTSMPRDEYLATQFRVLITYLRLLILPLDQSLEYDYPVFDSFFNLEVILSFISLYSLLIASVYLFWRSRTGDTALKLVTFGVFWFFLTNLVESGLIPIVDVIYEHRVYLPSIGIIIAGITGVFLFVKHTKRPALAKAVIALLLISQTGFVIATHVRNKVWGNQISLWENAVRNAPNKARAHTNLGYAYFKSGLLEPAVNQYETALGLDSKDPETHNNLGIILGMKGLHDKAIEHYLLACEINPGNAEAHNNLGIAYDKIGMLDKAHEHYKQAIVIRPDFDDAYNNLGLLYLKVGRIQEAQDAFEKALALNPGNIQARQFKDYVSGLSR